MQLLQMLRTQFYPRSVTIHRIHITNRTTGRGSSIDVIIAVSSVGGKMYSQITIWFVQMLQIFLISQQQMEVIPEFLLLDTLLTNPFLEGHVPQSDSRIVSPEDLPILRFRHFLHPIQKICGRSAASCMQAETMFLRRSFLSY